MCLVKMSNKKTLLLIGAGPTSSLISYVIHNNATLNNLIEIHVWEKARGIGGRFSTSRSPKNPKCYADLGAQYLTKSLDHPTSSLYFDNLVKHNLLRPLDVSDIPGFRAHPRKEHYACKQGASSVVKHFFEQASIQQNNLCFNRRVTKINPLPSGKVEVTAENQAASTFDFVVSTMPVPQILQLENSSELISDSKSSMVHNLANVKYSSRFALALFFDEPKVLDLSNKPLNFIENDPIFRYFSIENLKRTGTLEEPTSVVMHTNINYGASNAEKDKEELKPELLRKACAILPEAENIPFDSVKSHKWKYSQVINSFDQKPGCVKLNENIYAAGDGFTESGLEGCIDSAEKTVTALNAALLHK